MRFSWRTTILPATIYQLQSTVYHTTYYYTADYKIPIFDPHYHRTSKV